MFYFITIFFQKLKIPQVRVVPKVPQVPLALEVPRSTDQKFRNTLCFSENKN